MRTLSQFRTYAGLLAGLPNREMNKRHINRLLEEGESLNVAGSIPLLIPPIVVTRELTRRGEILVEERLPPISCLARFDSDELPSNTDPYSSLVVAWFQNSFGVPTDADILKQLQTIDWERYAAAWCW